MKITMEGKYQTRGESGLLEGKHPSVRILCVDGPSDEPVIGVIDGWDEPCQWTLDGHFWLSGVGTECDRDLIPVPTKREAWVIVGDIEPVPLFTTKEDAEKEMGARAYRGFLRRVSLIRWED